jgi:hypothetical protein
MEPQSFAQHVEALVNQTVDVYLSNQERAMRGVLE